MVGVHPATVMRTGRGPDLIYVLLLTFFFLMFKVLNFIIMTLFVLDIKESVHHYFSS